MSAWHLWPLVACMLAASPGRPGDKPDKPDPDRKPAVRAPASRPAGKTERPSGRREGEPVFNPTLEELDSLLDFARANFPEVHERLVQTRRDDPQAFREKLGKVGPPMLSLMKLARDNPREAEQLIRIQKLEMAIQDHRQRYRAAQSDEERNIIRAEGRRLMEEKFDARQQRARAEIDRLRQRLDEQNRHYAEQQQRRERSIDEEFIRMFEPPRPAARPPRPRPTAASRPVIID